MVLLVPFKANAEVREVTRRPSIPDTVAVSWSVSPSLKNSASGEGLRLRNGSTAIEERAGRVGIDFQIPAPVASATRTPPASAQRGALRIPRTAGPPARNTGT